MQHAHTCYTMLSTLMLYASLAAHALLYILPCLLRLIKAMVSESPDVGHHPMAISLLKRKRLSRKIFIEKNPDFVFVSSVDITSP